MLEQFYYIDLQKQLKREINYKPNADKDKFFGQIDNELTYLVNQERLQILGNRPLTTMNNEMQILSYKEMQENEIDKWETPNGIKITLVRGYLPTERKVMKFDERRLKDEHEEIYNKYLYEATEKESGRKDYVKITYGAKQC